MVHKDKVPPPSNEALAVSTKVPPPSNEALAVSTAEFGRLLGVSRATVYSLIADGKIKSIKLGKSRRVPVSEAKRLLEQGAA